MNCFEWTNPEDPEVKVVFNDDEKQWLVLVLCNFNGITSWNVYNSFPDLQSAMDWAMVPVNVQ